MRNYWLLRATSASVRNARCPVMAQVKVCLFIPAVWQKNPPAPTQLFHPLMGMVGIRFRYFSLGLLIGRETSNEQSRQSVSCGFAFREHFFMARGSRSKAGGPIRQTGKAGDFQPECARLNSFEDGGHADCLRAELAQHSHFNRRLILRPEQSGMHAFVQNQVLRFAARANSARPCFE